MKRNQWSAALLAVLLFGCGMVAGALGHRYYAATTVSARSAEDFRHRYVSEMQTRLKLTPAQTTQLETILDDTKAKYKAIRDEYRPAMIKIRNEQIARVKSILTPEQVPLYEQLVAEHQQHARDQDGHDRRDEHRLPPAADTSSK
ncbi:MAG: hypothetical protein JO340_06755 [Acidobacteriaceae bacterium]|nr:hypothetical protein [Acidobacteriaceae bacterium]